MLDKSGTRIVATHVGALPRPPWYNFSFNGMDFRRALMQESARTQYEDAVKVVLKDQELAEMDIVTDGGMRYDQLVDAGGWQNDVASRLSGIAWTGSSSSDRINPSMPPIVVEEILQRGIRGKVTEKLGPGTLNFSEFFKLTQSKTAKRVKFTVPDCVVTRRSLSNIGVYKDEDEMLFDIARIYNEQLKELVMAGCTAIQLDTPLQPLYRLGDKPRPEEWKVLIDAFNREVQGVNAQIWMHMCWGRPMGQVGSPTGEITDIARAFPYIAECKAQVLQLESASTKGVNLDKELSAWREYCSDKDLVVGVVNHRTTVVEPIVQGVEIIQKALKYVEPDRLGVSSDCGLGGLPRRIAYYKMKAISSAAKQARSQLA